MSPGDKGRPGSDEDFVYEDVVSNGVPDAELQAITDRIDMMVFDDVEEMDEERLAKVLASFEAKLMELNDVMRRHASDKMRAVSAECKRTKEAVAELSEDIDVVVKGIERP